MTLNINDLKKKIIYRSSYRGSKEMDNLLTSFVKKFIDEFNIEDLINLSKLLEIDDHNLYKYNQGLETTIKFEENKINNLFKNYRI